MLQTDFSDIQIWFLVVLGLGLLAQLYYFFGLFSKLAFLKVESLPVSAELPPVSVVIAARNEYENLERNLKAILEQDYPNFEVVVVNDCSWDDSQKLLEYYQEVYPNLKICKLIEQEKYPTGKKFALTIGIKAALHEHLVFTDADCQPAGNQWLRGIMASFTQGKEIVLGYSPYKSYSGLLNLFIRYEGALTSLFAFCSALANNPILGIGRNLAYTKTIFFRHKGFANHQHILSGDDDLFVNEAATSSNVGICLNPESFVGTEPKKTMDAWSRQKSRHVSTGKFYQPKHQALLGAYYAGLLIFYTGIVGGLLVHTDWKWILIGYGLKTLSQGIVFFLALRKLKQQHLVWFIPILDLLYVFYIYLFGLKGLFTKKRRIW
ncbi:MAG: glycosyltransferase [Bacteroidetes bacterium]|nr:glycosyltransferase [Bacteroidota bacterium]